MRSPESFFSFLKVLKFLCVKKAKEIKIPPLPTPALVLIILVPIAVVIVWVIIGAMLPPAQRWDFFSFLFQ